MQGYLTHFHNLERYTEFTLEIESTDDKLPFLDYIVHRKGDGSIRTTVHKKPSDTEWLPHYQLEHLKQVFAGIATMLFNRARNLYIGEENIRLTQREISNMLIEHGCLKTFLKH